MTDDQPLSSAEATSAASTNGHGPLADQPFPSLESSDIARELHLIYNTLDETRMQIGALELLMMVSLAATVIAAASAVTYIKRAAP